MIWLLPPTIICYDYDVSVTADDFILFNSTIRKNNPVTSEPKIELACPYCNASIQETLSWFKKTYSTCPSCGQGLAAGQFATVIRDLEQAMDAHLEEMIYGVPESSCCGKDSCCH
ncbi:MAG TPA: hypothetical protein VJ974_01655 [Geopsychrobacteraceae bacterium]|nr:hypothetical protein [Geopsychrobacteraceae bacterium]